MSEIVPMPLRTSNLPHLRRHLQDDSLAARLVDAYKPANAEDSMKELIKIAEERLKEIQIEVSTKESRNGED